MYRARAITTAVAGAAFGANCSSRSLCVQQNSPGKRLIITGGSNGIGAAIAKDWGSDKKNKVFVTGRSVKDLEAVVADIQKKGGSAAFGVGDVSVPSDVDRLYAEAKEYMGRVDVLVANAGCGGGRKALDETDIHVFERQYDTNVKGVFLWLKAVLPDMKAADIENQKDGEDFIIPQIVVTSSVAGKRACPMSSIYASTKWAVEGMVLSLRKELQMSGSRVKVGTINPAAVRTKWWDEPERGGRFPGYDQSTVPISMLAPEDCAQAARLIIDQPATSNVECVVLDAGS